MFKEIPMYTVICDSCGTNSSDGCEYAGWQHSDFALECAKDSDWIEHKENHYCPDCYEYDDQDNLVIKKIGTNEEN